MLACEGHYFEYIESKGPLAAARGQRDRVSCRLWLVEAED